MSNSVKLRKNRKQVGSGVVTRFKPTTMKMDDFTFDPIIGRAEELEAIALSLGRRSKNNVLLVGDPGVGKTAIAEGLAYNIENGKGIVHLR